MTKQMNEQDHQLHCRFILELGKALGLSHNTMATGAVYFHRFYMFHNFQDFPKYVSSFRIGMSSKASIKLLNRRFEGNTSSSVNAVGTQLPETW